MSHEEEAIEVGRKSVEERWTAEEAMLAIRELMNRYGYELSAEIQGAFAQGVMAAARKGVENEK